MQYTIHRKPTKPPPVEKVMLELSVDEVAVIWAALAQTGMTDTLSTLRESDRAPFADLVRIDALDLGYDLYERFDEICRAVSE